MEEQQASPARCVGYLRVSTERQAGETQSSLADQEAAIRDLAARLGTSVDRWYRDAGASGASIAARPAFRDLIRDCEAYPCPPRAPGLVLVLNDSRFGRFPDPDEAAALRFRLKQSGWIVRFAEGDDVQDVTFRSVVRSLGSAQASEYRRNIQRNARRGAKGAAEQGYWTREAPFGYRRRVVYPESADRVLGIGQLKAPNEKVKLTPHEGEAAIVRWMFESYASGGYSLGRLAGELMARAPGRRWSRTVVQHVLRNEAYAGDVVGGRRPADRSERLLTPLRPESEWYECRDAHPALVSREMFAAVRDRLAVNARKGPAVASTYLLSGLMTCPHCGGHYIGGGVANRRADKTRAHFYREAGGPDRICSGRMGTVTRALIDPLVIGVIAREARRPGLAREIDRAVRDALDQARGAGGETEAVLKRALHAAEQKRARLVAAITDGTVLHHEAAEPLAAIRSEIESARGRIEALRFRARRAGGVDEERDRLVALAMDFPAQAARMEGPALRSLVEPWIAHASFDKRTRVLTLGIHRTPGLQLSSQPGRTGQKETRVHRITIGSRRAEGE